MTEVPLEYLKAHVPEEYARKMRILEQGMMNAKQNNAKKVKMIESRQRWIKRRELADKFDI